MTAISQSTLLSDLAADLALPGVCPQCRGGALCSICWSARMTPCELLYSCEHATVLAFDVPLHPE
jgi:hypothetical protein